jgi:hypothetical protein
MNKESFYRLSVSEARDVPHVLVWDIETIPDIKGFAAANALTEEGRRGESAASSATPRRIVIRRGCRAPALQAAGFLEYRPHR